MTKSILLLVLFCVASCTTVKISHRAPSDTSFIDRSGVLLVDSPAARLSKPLTFPIEHLTMVSCRFQLAEPYYDDVWYPSLGIAFSKLGEFRNDVVGEQHVKLSASFTDSTLGRLYEITTSDNDETISTPFMRVVDSKRDITLSMRWHKDGYFSYRVREHNGTVGTAAIYRPNIKPTVATVLVSGIRGYLDCDSQIMSNES